MRYAIWNKQTLVTGISICLAFLVVIMGMSLQLSSEPTLSQNNRKLPIYCVDTKEKKIAITFDAAWGAEDTEELLAILEKHHAKATIFVVGDWARKYPDSVKAFYAAGHEIGNHSNSHKAYSKLSQEEISEDIKACNSAIQNAIGVSPNLVRAPSGDYSNATIEAAEMLGMQVVQWSVDSLDWKGIEVQQMVSRVIGKTENGSILLFHNDVKNTPKALEEILERLTEQGYSFVTVSALMYQDNYRIDAAGKQIPLENEKG